MMRQFELPFFEKKGSNMKRWRALFFVMMLDFFLFSTLAEDINGIWKGLLTTPGGNRREFSFSFKTDGNRFTGSVTGIPKPGMEYAIENGKVEGNLISFDVTACGPDGNIGKLNFTAQINGDVMKGSLTSPDGQRILFVATAVQDSAETAISDRLKY
jgi:hypothetical protein